MATGMLAANTALDAMLANSCTVEDCDRRMLAKGLCKSHYERNRRNGTPGPGVIAPDVRQDRLPRWCSVYGCSEAHKSNGLCSLHYRRWRTYGDTDAHYATGERHGHWKGDAVSYIGAHWRVIRQRGQAREHNCERCSNKAAQWAYDHLDPDERVERGLTFSVDPAHYLALCVSCHRQFDNAERRR